MRVVVSYFKMSEDEFNISIDLVERLISKQFPKWSHEKIKKAEAEGTDHLLFRLGSDRLIRFPKRFSASLSVKKEVILLPKLAQSLPMRIPKVIGYGKPQSNYPFPWLICDWIEGSTPHDPAMIKDDAAALEMGNFVQSMHKVHISNGPRSSRGYPLERCTELVKHSIKGLDGGYDLQLLDRLWELTLKTPKWSGDPVWIHGDLHPGNLLVEKDKLVGGLDFGLAGIGDPACDMMVAWSLLKSTGRELFKSIVKPDEETWLRGRGWALFLGITGYAHYRLTNPRFAAIAKHTLDKVIRDFLS